MKQQALVLSGVVAAASILFGCSDQDVAPSVVVDDVVAIRPAVGSQGASLNLRVLSSGGILAEETTVALGDGITVLGATRFSPEEMHLRIGIDFDAPLGVRDVTIVTNGQTVTLTDGFSVQPWDAPGGMIRFVWNKETVSTAAGVDAVAVFGSGATDLRFWVTGSPTPSPVGEVVFQCLEGLGPECALPPPAGPLAYDSAGDALTITSDAEQTTLTRVFGEDGFFAYYGPDTLEPSAFAPGTQSSVASPGGIDVPPFAADFFTPSDINVTSIDLSRVSLSLLQGDDWRVTWEPAGEPTDPEARVVLQMALTSPTSGPMAWVTATVPDTGTAVIPGADLDRLGPGDVGVTVMRETRTELRLSDYPPITILAQVVQQGAGVIYPTGTLVGTIDPEVATQGDTLDIAVTLLGVPLVDGQSAIGFGAGTTVNSLTINSPSSAVANVTIDVDTPEGYRDLIVFPSPAATPVRFPQRLTIDKAMMACTVEEAKAEVLSGTLVAGDVACGAADEAGDVDTYAFQASAGDVVALQLFSRFMGSSLYSRLILYDSGNTELARFDSNDGFIIYPVTADDTYQVAMESRSSGFGVADYWYFLTLDIFATEPLAPLPAFDTCADIPVGFSLTSGTYYLADTASATHTTYSEFSSPSFVGCLTEQQVGGHDLVFPVALDPGQTVTAWTVNPDNDVTLYLLDSCGAFASCWAGVDNTTAHRPEMLAFRNDTSTAATYYLVVDADWSASSAQPAGGPIYLQIRVD